LNGTLPDERPEVRGDDHPADNETRVDLLNNEAIASTII
jgi:hypothetical protein